MAITKLSGRQEIVSAYVDIAFGDLTSGSNVAAIDMPVNAIVVGGDLVVTTAFNSATSDALIVGDVTTTNRYLASTSIAATGRTALTLTGFTVTATQPAVRVTWTGVGAAPTAGAFRLRVDYIVKGRAAFAQG